MQTYNITGDLIDERAGYLKYILLGSAFVAVPVFAFYGVNNALYGPLWLCVFIALIASNEFRRRGHIEQSAWSYLGGLLATGGLLLIRVGPNPALFVLMTLPLVLSILLLDKVGIVRLAGLTGASMYGLVAAQTNILTAINLTYVYLIFCGALTAVIYINASNVLETVYWATDVQKKDSSRAEILYEQKEQLGEALRQLTHTKSKLELTNKRLEEAQHRAEQASRAKSVFLSNMSHELRTPLNVVIGYTSTMLDMPRLYEDIALPGAYRSDIQLIKESGYYLLGLINDILDLSKIEAGKLELHYASMSLPDILPGLIATCIGLVKDKALQIRPDYDVELPAVWADSIRVRQIILNLMSNAIKFTHTGSVTLRARHEGDSVRISVIDTGIGIPENALMHIFDRFEQATADTDRNYGGTGLGLDISRRLAQMHGGDLVVESTLGQGSTFSFVLPISHEINAVSIVPGDLDAIDRSTELMPSVDTTLVKTILVIEDEASLREMMHRTLESVGHMVVDVQDGAEAWELATALLPDLIVLDINLPNISGWELLERLKKDVETNPIPVIICTVNEDEERATKLGAASYLRKPFSADELIAYIDKFLPQPTEVDRGV